MIQFANKTDLILSVGLNSGATLNDEVVAPTKRNLGDLAALSVLRGRLFVQGGLVSGSGHVLTVQFRASGVVVGELIINQTNSWSGDLAVDLTTVSGAADLDINIKTDTGGGVTSVNAWLEVTHPVIFAA